MLHELIIPDELLSWGKDPARAKRWPAPWAHVIEKMLAQPQPLSAVQATALFARLEALCAEAVREGQPELLLGFDIYSAARLGLVYRFEEGQRCVTLGCGQDVDYAELEVYVRSKVSPDGFAAAQQCKELLSQVFPNGRVDAMLDSEEGGESCTGCGQALSAVSFTMESGNEYCRECWEYLTGPWPRTHYRGTKLVVTRGES